VVADVGRRQRLLFVQALPARRRKGQDPRRRYSARNARDHPRSLQGAEDTNVEPVLGTLTDPKLPESSVDMMLLSMSTHEFDHPYEMTDAMVKALKPGGRLVFVEFRLEDEDVPIKLVHKMSEKQVFKEMSVFPQLQAREDLLRFAVATCDRLRKKICSGEHIPLLALRAPGVYP